jgi:hypothetical protein
MFLASAAGSLVSTFSAAAPPAPGGWTADSKGNVTIYRSVADPAVELRLHTPDGDRGAIDVWFSSPTEMGPEAQ